MFLDGNFDLGALDPQKLIQLAMNYNPAPVLEELAKGPVPPFTSLVMPQPGQAKAPNVPASFADLLYGGGVGSPQALVETTRKTPGAQTPTPPLDAKQIAALQALMPQAQPRYAPAVAPSNLYRPGQMMLLPTANPVGVQPGLASILYGRK